MSIKYTYEKRLVAFIDIIGWQEAIVQKDADKIAKALNIFSQLYQPSTRKYKETVQKEMKLRKGRANPLYFAKECALFSDSIILSSPFSHEGRIFNHVSDLCRELLALGFLTRGGISVGELYHKENYIFGPALNEAVALEQEAIFPRIICSPQLLDVYKTWKYDGSFLVADQLGREVVNLFIPSYIDEDLSIIKRMLDVSKIRLLIKRKINYFEKNVDTKKLKKWVYIQNLMESQLDLIDPSI